MGFHYQDNSKFLDTNVHYTEHVAVMSYVGNFRIIEIQNTLFIIVAHLDTSAFIRKLTVNFSYCVLIALICETITFCKCDNDILDNRDNFIVNIDI